MDDIESFALWLTENFFYRKKEELGRHLTKFELDETWKEIVSGQIIPPKYHECHDDIFKIIQTHVEVRQAEDVSIVKDVRKWLDKRKNEGGIEFSYWNRYKKLLLMSFPYDVVDTLDKSTDKIIDFSGDPQEKMDTRGLIMGEVQSGKTANYTGVICKAADLGYKVIIVV